MRINFLLIGTLAGALALPVIGCNKSSDAHKVIATNGQHAVPMYPDEATYQKDMQATPPVAPATVVDDQTPVVIVSSDGTGAVIHIIDGPLKGQDGFVPKDNVD